MIRLNFQLPSERTEPSTPSVGKTIILRRKNGDPGTRRKRFPLSHLFAHTWTVREYHVDDQEVTIRE
jgi:hypothetical protein